MAPKVPLYVKVLSLCQKVGAAEYALATVEHLEQTYEMQARQEINDNDNNVFGCNKNAIGRSIEL